MHQGRAGGLTAAVLGAGAAAALGYQLWRRWPRLRLAGRTALVTGGSRGLGLGLAHELLLAGMQVAFCARDGGEVQRAARQLQRRGRVHGAVCDVTDADAVKALIADVERRLGPIDVLVNNAGQMLVGPLEHMRREDFDAAMAVHFRGPLHATLALLPGMRRRRRGHIVNIASIGGVVAVPHMAPYVASKFALVGLSRALREELAGSGVRVTTVCPGPMRTGSQLGAWFKGRHRDEYAWFAASGALPLVSTGGLRAARRIVAAIRSGEPELTIGVPARLLRWFDALAPGLATDLSALVEKLVLPAPGGIGAQVRRGADSDQRLRGSWLAGRIDAAAAELQP